MSVKVLSSALKSGRVQPFCLVLSSSTFMLLEEMYEIFGTVLCTGVPFMNRAPGAVVFLIIVWPLWLLKDKNLRVAL
jgi:hypothetical protein